MSLLEELRQHRNAILMSADKCGLTNIRVFGSVARGEETPESDVDLLVDVKPDDIKGLETFGFPSDVEELIGRKVDMVFASGLYHVIRDQVLSEAQPL